MANSINKFELGSDVFEDEIMMPITKSDGETIMKPMRPLKPIGYWNIMEKSGLTEPTLSRVWGIPQEEVKDKFVSNFYEGGDVVSSLLFDAWMPALEPFSSIRQLADRLNRSYPEFTLEGMSVMSHVDAGKIKGFLKNDNPPYPTYRKIPCELTELEGYKLLSVLLVVDRALNYKLR